MRISLVCPNCGEELKQQGPPPRLPDEPSVGIPRGVILLIIIIIVLIGGYFFMQSSVYLKVKAKGLIEKGEYATAIDILDDIIDKAGFEPDLIALISEAMLSQAEERMDNGDYREAIPVLNNVIEKNENAQGVDRSKENILKATYDKAISCLGLAQEEGKYVAPFSKELTDAVKAVESAMEIIEDVEVEWASEMKADLHMLSATIATERASYFHHMNDKPQAKVYLNEAEEELESAMSETDDRQKYSKLSIEIYKLRASIYGRK